VSTRRGVRYGPRRVLTQSLSMRSRSGAVRVIDGRHHAVRSNLIRTPAGLPAQ
jgi:fructose-1,6-bisphosphatase II